MSNVEDHHSSRAPEPVGSYPHAKRVGNLLFLSGVGPRSQGSSDIPGVTLDEDGTMIAVDIEAQCRSCFENLRMVLEDAGAKWTDLVDVLVFLTDMKRDFTTYNRIYGEYFAGRRKSESDADDDRDQLPPDTHCGRGEGCRLHARLKRNMAWLMAIT